MKYLQESRRHSHGKPGAEHQGENRCPTNENYLKNARMGLVKNHHGQNQPADDHKQQCQKDKQNYQS